MRPGERPWGTELQRRERLWERDERETDWERALQAREQLLWGFCGIYTDQWWTPVFRSLDLGAIVMEGRGRRV